MTAVLAPEVPDSIGGRPPFRLAAIDIDGTLLGPDGTISAANAAAIARLLACGVQVVLASGRSHANMLPYQRALGLRGPIISAQGAVVRDSDGHLIAEYALPVESVRALTEAGRRAGVAVSHYRGDGIFIEHINAAMQFDQSRNADPHVIVSDLLRTPAPAHKVMWIDAPARIAQLAQTAPASFAALAGIVQTDPEYLEFLPLGVDKATGVAAVARAAGIDATEVAAFGDGNNDVPMLAWAGWGVALAHARPSAKAAARVVGPEGDPADALARAIACVWAPGV